MDQMPRVTGVCVAASRAAGAWIVFIYRRIDWTTDAQIGVQYRRGIPAFAAILSALLVSVSWKSALCLLRLCLAPPSGSTSAFA